MVFICQMIVVFIYLTKPTFQLTALLAEIGLNIREAHAFSTVNGYSLDVFVVDGWPYEVRFKCDSFKCQQILR